jgi:hypothetical protein
MVSKKKLTHFPYEHGGLKLRDFKLSSISLKTFWARAIMKEYSGQKPMWLQILEYFLTLEVLNIKYLFEICHSDLTKIAYKLKEHSNFWSNTIYEIAQVIEEIENETTFLTELLLFGGRFAKLTNNKNLSIFGCHSISFRNFLDAGVSKVQDMARETAFQDLVNCKKFKKSSDFPTLNITFESSNSLLLSLSRFANKTLEDMGLYPNLEFIQLQKKNYIQEFYQKHERGCSQVYKLLLKAYLRDNCIKPPPALATASLSYNFNFNQKKWQDSLKYV